jgi:hypothetical protein
VGPPARQEIARILRGLRYRREMNGRLALLVAALGLGCAAAPPESSVEAAYAEARATRTTCRPGDAPCCAERVKEARALGERGESARAAHLWEDVALACPVRRAEATAAVMVPASPATPGAAPEVLNVTYRPRLSPAVRLYWVSTSARGHLLPQAGSEAGPQTLDVEIQAIRFAGTRPGPLLSVERRFDLALTPGATVTIDIAEAPAGAPSPLEVNATVDAAPATAPRRAPAPVKPGPPPRLEPARAVTLARLRAPREFDARVRGGGPGLRLCLDRDGHLDSVRFLEPAHPRLAAALVDMLRDSRHEPYRVNDLAVPSCQAFHPNAS